MFDLYEFIKQLRPTDHLFSCTGSSYMEGLLDDVRDTKFPCWMVEIGDEGFFDMLSGMSDTRTLVFYRLYKGDNPTANDIREMQKKAKAEGMALLKDLRSLGNEYGDKAYGIEFSRMVYFKVGPLGFDTYGYCFNLTLTEE